jgi:hypothetical protein
MNQSSNAETGEVISSDAHTEIGAAMKSMAGSNRAAYSGGEGLVEVLR